MYSYVAKNQSSEVATLYLAISNIALIVLAEFIAAWVLSEPDFCSCVKLDAKH